jgi:hypothetical protein
MIDGALARPAVRPPATSEPMGVQQRRYARGGSYRYSTRMHRTPPTGAAALELEYIRTLPTLFFLDTPYYPRPSFSAASDGGSKIENRNLFHALLLLGSCDTSSCTVLLLSRGVLGGRRRRH